MATSTAEDSPTVPNLRRYLGRVLPRKIGTVRAAMPAARHRATKRRALRSPSPYPREAHSGRCRLRWTSRPPLGPIRDVVTVAPLPLLLLRWISAEALLPEVVECAPLAEIDEPVSPVDRFRLPGKDEQLGAEPGVLLEAQRRR